MNRPVVRSLAYRVLAHAQRLLPPRQTEWARAMRSELEHLDGDYEALAWALGCLWASIKMRSRAMVLGNFHVSRWVLALEMALCFGPLTLGWVDILFGGSGLVWLDSGTLENYIGSPGGTTVLAILVALAILGVLGPLGVVFALRAIVLGRPLHDRRVVSIAIAGSVLIGVVLLAQRLLLPSIAGVIEVVGMLIMFSALPAAGIAHLSHLGVAPTLRPLAA